MSIVSIPVNARAALLDIADKQRDAPNETMREYYETMASGFFACLRAEYPSETVGLLVMDFDCRLEGKQEFTNLLPRVVLSDGRRPFLPAASGQ